jgi:hypothetical protein
MAVLLTLGGVVFEDFEVPESINFGGEQMLLVHKLPGGSRVIDAMGRDDKDITWSGRFRGGNAELRARALDFLRIQGQPLTLTWSTQLFQVVIRSFDATFQQSFEIPYTITCTVLNDEFTVLGSLLTSIDQALGIDLNSALTLGGALNLAAITAALAQVQTVVATVQTVKNAAPASLASISGAILATGVATTAAIGSATALLNTGGSVAGVVAGGSPSSMASALSNQAGAYAQLAQLYQLSSTVGRMTTNMANIGS